MKNKTLHPRINQVKWEEKETHGYTKKKMVTETLTRI